MHFAAHLWMPFVDFVFMRRALIGGLVLACSTAPLGVFLILRRMSLIGDAVAHGILPGAGSGTRRVARCCRRARGRRSARGA